MFQKSEKLHPHIFTETSLPLSNCSEPCSVENCQKVDALGLHVLLLGARERQVSLLEPLFKIPCAERYDSRLEILTRSDTFSDECFGSTTHSGITAAGAFGFLASIEPHTKAAALLLEGRIVNPFTLLTTRQLNEHQGGEERMTFILSFPTEDETLAEASLLLIQSIDDRIYETVEWQNEEHFHHDTQLRRHTFSFRPRPTTLIFPFGAPSL